MAESAAPAGVPSQSVAVNKGFDIGILKWHLKGAKGFPPA